MCHRQRRSLPAPHKHAAIPSSSSVQLVMAGAVSTETFIDDAEYGPSWLAPGGGSRVSALFNFHFVPVLINQRQPRWRHSFHPIQATHSLSPSLRRPQFPCKLRCPQHSRAGGSRPRNIQAAFLCDCEAAVCGSGVRVPPPPVERADSAHFHELPSGAIGFGGGAASCCSFPSRSLSRPRWANR